MPRMPTRPGLVPPSQFLRQQEALQVAQAMALHEAGQLAEAKAAYEAILRLNPRHAEVLARLGTLQLQAGQVSDAIRLFDLSLRINPAQPSVHNNRGVALCEIQRFEAALADFDRAIALNFAGALKNRANALTYLARYEEALAAYEQAVTYDAGDAEIYHNRVPALLSRRDYQGALTSLERAIALRPDYADAQFHKAELLLLLEDFAQGWHLFEWRWRLDQARETVRDLPMPLWIGAPTLAGRSILLHAEQGFGDTLQMCRYVSLLAAQGAQVVLEVPPPLLRLMQRLAGPAQLIARGDALPACDFHCPLMSLPLALGTTPATIPSQVPYLSADPALVAQWASRLGERRRRRIGLVWFGSSAGGLSHLKSMAFDDILPLTDADADFFALQKHDGNDAAAFQQSDRITDLGPGLGDFADTAAAIAQLDLVISIDTAVAHLAGALGKPVWVLLSHLQDWRWRRDGETTPWYPTAQLFRQTAPNDWSTVIAQVRAALATQA